MIYIQADDSGMPHHFDAACALYGAKDSNSNYSLITLDRLSNMFNNRPVSVRSNLFVGSIDFMQEVFRLAECDVPSLPHNSDRPSEVSTIQQVMDRIRTGEKLFVKPAGTNTKRFTGVFVKTDADARSIQGEPSDAVLVYQPFAHEIVSEWRIYVHRISAISRYKVADAHCYSGDPLVAPDSAWVADRLLWSYDKGFPCAMTMDVAVLQNSDHVIVEFNDMWAIGNYGIPNDLYLRLLYDRYGEIMRKA